jgi:hypothetical protein
MGIEHFQQHFPKRTRLICERLKILSLKRKFSTTLSLVYSALQQIDVILHSPNGDQLSYQAKEIISEEETETKGVRK